MSTMTEKYGPWGIIAGGSDGIGSSFAHDVAARGLNVVLVARRPEVLEAMAEEVRKTHNVEVRTISLDLSAPTAATELWKATSDLEVGLFVYNAGGDDRSLYFLDKTLDTHLSLVRRNCESVLEAAYRFGGPMVERGRGGIILVTSGAAWAGGARLAAYAATKAFDLVLAEALWAEWHQSGVDVLGLVLGATDTPSLHRVFDEHAWPAVELADPDDVARAALDNIAEGPTYIWGDDPHGGSPFGSLSRREAVQMISQGAAHHDEL